MTIVGAESSKDIDFDCQLAIKHIQKIRSDSPELKDSLAFVLVDNNIHSVAEHYRSQLSRKENVVVMMEDTSCIRWRRLREDFKRNKAAIKFHGCMVSEKGDLLKLKKQITDCLNSSDNGRNFGIMAAIILNWTAMNLVRLDKDGRYRDFFVAIEQSK